MIVQGHYETDIRVRRKAEALVAAGFEVDVLALRSEFSSARELNVVNGVTVHTLELGKKRGSRARYAFEYVAFFLWVLWRLPAMARRRHYIAVEINTLPDFLVFAAFSARLRGAAIVLDMHEITPEFYMSKYKVDDVSWPVRLLSHIERACMAYADHVITINEPVQNLLVSRGLERANSTVLMNCADDRLFEAELDDLPASGDRDKHRFVFMYHGTLTRMYGLDIAIEAFALARTAMPGAEMWILGNGPERDALVRLATQRGVGASVRFVGTVLPEQVHKWLRQCDVGVLPTRQDRFLDYSFSNKLSEYVIMEKPVACSRLRTIRHYFSEDAIAFFEPENASALANVMTALFSDAGMRRRLACRAKQDLEPISWRVMKEKYVALMTALERTRPSRAGVPTEAS
jgi:glycosyltransferase involved in cell wall biosynthesis